MCKFWIISLLWWAGVYWPATATMNGLNYNADFLTPREANLQCNGASKLKQIVIRNPSVINKDLCAYAIRPYSANVCQLLIQFQRFELQPPTLNPLTSTLECGDYLSIGDFTLCGVNTGQHLYLPFEVENGVKEIFLTFNLPNRWSQSNWNLVITQLECPRSKKRSPAFMPFGNAIRTFLNQPVDSFDVLPPSGCNQYFTQLSGNIRSFNYKDDGSSYYLPNMNYVICIKSMPGATMIEYQALKFSMSNEIDSSAGYDNDCHSFVQTEGRREDYLMIPQSFVANSLSIVPTYYCGTSLETRPSLVAAAPFIMYFSSDGITDETETGFSINYRIRTAF